MSSSLTLSSHSRKRRENSSNTGAFWGSGSVFSTTRASFRPATFAALVALMRLGYRPGFVQSSSPSAITFSNTSRTNCVCPAMRSPTPCWCIVPPYPCRLACESAVGSFPENAQQVFHVGGCYAVLELSIIDRVRQTRTRERAATGGRRLSPRLCAHLLQRRQREQPDSWLRS